MAGSLRLEPIRGPFPDNSKQCFKYRLTLTTTLIIIIIIIIITITTGAIS